MRFGQAHDAHAGPESLFRVAPVAQDYLNQDRAIRADAGGFALYAVRRPVRMAAVTGWHMITQSGVLMVGRGPDMRRDPLPFGKNLDGSGCYAHPDLLAQKLMRDRIVVAMHVDVIISATKHNFHSA